MGGLVPYWLTGGWESADSPLVLKLVVGGVYRYLRNPMYVAVIAVILGQAAILGRPVLLVYAAIFWLVVASFVSFYEEPTLSRRYGEQYAAYRRAVRGWWPRLTPWDGDHGSMPRSSTGLRAGRGRGGAG